MANESKVRTRLMLIRNEVDAEYARRLERARAVLGSFNSGGMGGQILASLRNRDIMPPEPEQKE